MGRYQVEADNIASEFRRKLDALRGRVLPRDMAAAVKALQDETQAAKAALHDRRAAKRYAEKKARQEQRDNLAIK